MKYFYNSSLFSAKDQQWSGDEELGLFQCDKFLHFESEDTALEFAAKIIRAVEFSKRASEGNLPEYKPA